LRLLPSAACVIRLETVQTSARERGGLGVCFALAVDQAASATLGWLAGSASKALI
jgi:hypothetical protein